MAVNLRKIKAFATAELTKRINQLKESLLQDLGDFRVLNAEIVEKKFAKLKEGWLADYTTQISVYDAGGLPEEYADHFRRGFDTASAEARQTVSSKWRTWVLGNSTSQAKSLDSTLAELSKKTSVGNLSVWESAADSAESSSVSKFNNIIHQEYKWENAETVKANYKEAAASAKSLAKAAFQKNDGEVKEHIQTELGK